MLEEEYQYLLDLPEKEYPVFKEEVAKSNKYGEITLDQAKVYVPKGFNFTQLQVIKYWNRFKVLSPHGEILCEGYRPYMEKNREIPWTSILKAWIRKSRAVPYSRFFTYLPGRVSEYFQIPDLEIRKERINWIIALLTRYQMEEINEYFYELIERQSNSLIEPVCHPFDVDWTK